ncbi:capsular polysaccharide export protein, LipB/KpsS family [Flavobacterium inviolabile]|uniref:capsular polysaccharide export protein, LipB/KpsS family n=1 Tax=Flavobacterium inviolabile TaxID=2748320 RepID=UPI0015B1A48A|nr:hypothetical protein [Flavobacterium inviolabile]
MTNIDSIFNKTILVQTTYHPTPHLETEMEIVERLLEQGNTIYWLICKSDFKVCFENPKHIGVDCKVCYSRVLNSSKFIQKINQKGENLHVLHYKDFLNMEAFKTKQFHAPDAFEDIQSLKKFTFKTYDSGMATASSLVSYTRNHEPDVKEHKDFIFRGLLTGAYLYETFQLVIDKIKPDLVIFFNGRFIENRPLLRVCQERKLDYATHERGGKINRFLFRVNSIPHSIQTVSEEMEYLWENAIDDKVEIGKMFYLNRIKRVEDAWYSFTKEQQEGNLPASINTDRKIVTIFNSSLDEYEGLEGFGPYFYPNDNEGIKRICESLKDNDKVKLYLRVHPNLKGLDNSQNRFIENEIEKKYPSIEIIKAEDSIDTYALINKSDIIIVFGSTVGAEAAFAGKNVILLGHAAYEKLNCVFIPKNHEEVISAINDDNFVFPMIDKEATLKYGYWNESFGFDYKYYEPINIAGGTYRGKRIRASRIWRKARYYVKKFSGQ